MTPKRLTPIQAIKNYCKQYCCCGDLQSWKLCTKEGSCPLYPYRLGKRPISKPFQEYCKPKHRDLTINSVKEDVLEKSKEVENARTDN